MIRILILSHSTTDAIYPGSSAYALAGVIANSNDQIPILTACLANGDLTRAEEVAQKIMSVWLKSHQVRLENNVSEETSKSLSDVLPPKIHADFVRAYFAAALFPNTKSSPTDSQKSMLVQKAWSYFEGLFSHVWEVTEGRRTTNTALDAGVFAMLFKGFAAIQQRSWQSLLAEGQSSVHLLAMMEENGIKLLDVIRDPVFDAEGDAYLGVVGREAVLTMVEEEVSSQDGSEFWSRVLSETKSQLKRDEEGKEAFLKEIAELNPTKKASKRGGSETNVALETLRANLNILDLPSSDASVTPATRQRLLEESSYDAARQLYIHEREELTKVGLEKEGGLKSTWLNARMFEWLKEMETRLAADAPNDDIGFKGKWGEMTPFMTVLSPDKMALVTIVEVLRMCGGGGISDGMKATRAILYVGKAIEHEYHTELLKKELTKKGFQEALERQEELNSNTRFAGNKQRSIDQLWRKEMAQRESVGDTTWTPAWTQQIRAKVGSLLVAALVDVAKVERVSKNPVTGESYTELQPAFTHAYQYVRATKLGIIKVNPAIAERMDQDPLRISLSPRLLPMLVKPKPWTAWNDGAYLLHSSHVMRTKDSEEQIQYLKQSSNAQNLDDVFAGLDVLGGVAWQINKPIFEVVSKVWNSGDAFADIPAQGSLEGGVSEVEVPADIESNPRSKGSYRIRVRQLLMDKRSAHSTRCDVNYKLEIARAYLEETFHFPHNLDFRGRAYPIPPNLSHIGNDLCRGILKFAEAKPLGERGLRWLKIHLANLAGFDKASFDEREAFAMEHLDDVFDSADKPLEGKRWWLKADDPWQALATCMELTNALRSPSPTEFLSSLPIHQDGTCNGLQHYAALGGDLLGASQVNLEVGDRPADVYSGVATMTNAIIDRDAAEGHEFAKMLQGKVTRKVVKQTVMTTVYGVTFIGAKRQIEKQLKERGDIPADQLYQASSYLGRIVLDSIGDVFKGATGIQTWLNRCARLISKSIPENRLKAAGQPDKKSRGTARLRIPKEQMTSVIWTTPLGLPVVQPYRKPKKRQVSTALQTCFITDPSVPAEVDPRAQATAFPPNFIHSLDATHMMMTALACKDKIAFASVHDSYWTHACSVDEMSVILRDAFIELHQQDILGNLRKEFLQRYAGNVVPVSKVPAGLKYSHVEGDDVKEVKPKKSKAPNPGDEVIKSIETEDGVKTTWALPEAEKDADSEIEAEAEGEGESSVNMDELRLKTPRTAAKSRFVELADILPPVPPKGDFDLNRIRDSLYFFS
ncbi:mitochondrial RNA polymerase [Pseudohyphozyma bogoriensis]|nr:mitochondrial RNA polymerase [Pseudohyphozyma bogoriensis]